MRFALFTLLLVPAATQAQVFPQPVSGNPYVQSVDYVPDQLIVLQGAPGYQLTLEFAPDERIENVAIGDSAAWQVTANKRGDRLFLKPVQPDVATNMTVVTDARLYVFQLSPPAGSEANLAYIVRFRYPGASGPVDQGDASRRAPGRYRLHGASTLKPATIHDDGVHTYIRWPDDRALPAVYAIDEHGRETLINGMMRDGSLVIDSVQARLVFRVDSQKATAVRVRVKSK